VPSVIRVAREFTNVTAEYSYEKIPNYLGKLTLDSADVMPDDSSYINTEEFKDALKSEDLDFFKYFSQIAAGRDKGVHIVFQGRDSAGKSSSVVHLLELSPKGLSDVHIVAPTQDEKAHGYLWRFGKFDRQPPLGGGTIWDRSWAERVLAEKVMKISSEGDIQNSYSEIRTFEWLQWKQGYIFIKIWIEISEEEQGRRFEMRQMDAPWKLSDSDQISRANWDDYSKAANELFYRTGTDYAPWYVISGMNRGDKLLTVMKIVNKELKKALSIV
jgi:polyphosphate kinase 2 (PPK2 family)